MRLLVYSHDAYGLGNVRRMLAICEHLLHHIPNLSILLLSGSPMLQGFRMSAGIDYIKLPCLNRGETGTVTAKYLGSTADEIATLRAEIILSAVSSFKPDLMLVDKKPYGIKNELLPSLQYLKSTEAPTKLVLLLRDILDAPERTIADWQANRFTETAETYYDRLLVVGMPEVFDFCRAYQLPRGLICKTHFCGYIRRPAGLQSPPEVRQMLGLRPKDPFILVTPGGGEDGYQLVKTYLDGLPITSRTQAFQTLILTGPEMPTEQKAMILAETRSTHNIQVQEFTDDPMSYIAAADIVVAMGGYNTICEILSAQKRAVVVPRIKPSQEQLVRAANMSRMGLFQAIHPDRLTPRSLLRATLTELNRSPLAPRLSLDLDALPRITEHVIDIVRPSQRPRLFCLPPASTLPNSTAVVTR
jgi:predicted glycosyltransferase